MATLTVIDRSPLLELVFTRPEKYNAIDEEMLQILSEQFLRYAMDPDLRLLLLRAKGAYFSAGADVRSGLMPDLSHGSPQRFRQWLERGPTSLSRLSEIAERIEKPLIVAHQGPCLGGALELSLAFDFRIAAASATYGLPETKLGAVPSAGGTARLTRLIGPHWARWLLIAGQTISSAKAESIGLVHAVHADADFEQAVEIFCSAMLQMPPEAIGAAKLAIELATDLDLAGARSLERITASSVTFGDEFKRQLDKAVSKVGSSKSQPTKGPA
jgi:enoyl-CoA hydratase/carnithine racemase